MASKCRHLKTRKYRNEKKPSPKEIMRSSALESKSFLNLETHDISPDAKWSDAHDRLMAAWDRHCSFYSAMHNLTGETYHKRHKFLGGSVAVLGSIGGIIQFSRVSLCGDTYTAMNIIAGILIVFLVACSALQMYMKYDVEAEQHTMKANAYMDIRDDLRTLVSFDRDCRPPVHRAIPNMNYRIRTLRNDRFQVPEKIAKQFISQVDRVLCSADIRQDPPTTTTPAREKPRVVQGQTSSPIVVGSGDTEDVYVAALNERLDERQNAALKYNMERFNTNVDGFKTDKHEKVFGADV